MRLLGIVLAAFCAVAFVIAAPIGVAAFSVDRNFLSVATWRSALDRTGFYSALPDMFTATLRQEEGAAYGALPEADVRAIAENILPAEVARPVIDDMISQLVAYGRAESDRIDISLTDLKQEMETRFPQAILQHISARPVCARREDYGSFNCQPRPEDRAEYEARLREAARVAWAHTPDSFTYPDGASGPNEEQRAAHVGLAKLMTVAPYAPLVLLAFVAIFAVRGTRGFLLWIGAPLMAAGAALWGLWALGRFTAREMVDAMREDFAPTDPSMMLVPPFDLVTTEFVQQLFLWALVVSVAGFGMTVAGAMTPRTEREN
ncbi:MAG: hypothetical protein AB7O98_09420 [Hyphomonadaceae bacterium]